MKEVLVDLRKYDLCDELEVDLISIEDLLSKLEDSLCEIKELKDKIKELEEISLWINSAECVVNILVDEHNIDLILDNAEIKINGVITKESKK